MQLAESTWTDAEAVETDLALLPVGSTEQHGPHAPLGTDSLAAEAIARAGADAYDDDVLIAPTLPYGISAEHRQFTGTLWLTPDTFRAAVRDVVASLGTHGWNRIVIVNGHGGNTDALREVAAAVSRSETAYAAVFTWFDAIGTEDVSMGHGGPVETAVLRAHRPDLIRDERIGEAAAGGSDRWGEWVDGVNLAYDAAEFTGNGVVGDPARGTEDLGEELRARAGTALADVLDAVADRDLDRPAHK